ncbi:MAG TPA: carboxypeptidase-like regulatory domain-containing protein, partial [Chthoniobacterales bacterium]
MSNSVATGVSEAVRNLPAAGPITRNYVEHELPPVKPLREVPENYVDRVVQDALGALAMPATNVTFEGMTQEEACGGCIPPDTTGAIGPSQYVQMTNSALSVYSKNGTRLSGPTAINQLFASLPADNACRVNNNGDPIVVYDQLADRWLLSQFAIPGGTGPNGGYHECIAISQSGDATGAYYLYDFFLSSTRFEDYPHIGLWPDAYYMMTHGFNTAGTAYLGAGAYAFEREKMLAGDPTARLVFFTLAGGNTSYGGHLPASLDGFTLPPAGAPNYFVEVDNAADFPATGAAMRIWKFHVDWTNPANSTFGVTTGGVNNSPNFIVPVADFVRPPCSLLGNRAYVMGCVPQLGDPSQLDPIGDRLMFRLAYRNFGDHEALVLTHTVVANSTTGQMGPRWYEVRDPGGSPTISQQSTFAPAGPTDPYRFLGSIAMDRAGDIAIGYSASSLAQFPSINYAGRLVSDPANALSQGEAVLQAGNGAQHGEAFAPQTGRWGDYSTITVDPVDDCTFWYTNEYYDNPAEPTANWHTRIGSFKFPSCTPRPVGFLTGTVVRDPDGNPIAGAKVTAGGYIAITSNGGVYQFSPLAPGTYTVTASATGYFPMSDPNVVLTNGNTTRKDFVLMRNLAEPTPTPPPLPGPLQNVNPPVLNDPGATTTSNHYGVSWSAAEVTTGLAKYVLEQSTDYVVSLFDNADGTAMPGDAASPWTRGNMTNPWIQDPAYRHSLPNSYYCNGEGSFGVDSSLTLKNAITIPAS